LSANILADTANIDSPQVNNQEPSKVVNKVVNNQRYIVYKCLSDV